MRIRFLVLTLVFALFAAIMPTACGGGAPAATTAAATEAAKTTAAATTAATTKAAETTAAEAPAKSAQPWDTSKNDEVVLSVIDNYYTAGWKKMAADYTALHPETKVTVDVVSDNDAYFAKMTTWLTGDTWTDSADIIHINFAQGPVGGYSVMFKKGMIYDFRKMFDEPNPYNGGKPFKDCLDMNAVALDTAPEGVFAIPFDWVGVAIIYNKSLLESKSLSMPTSYEQFDAVCKKLRDGGMQYPIAASAEASWYLMAFADAAFRGQEQEFLVQPEDAIWEEELMAPNRDFKFDENDFTRDRFTVFSPERMAKWRRENKGTDPKTVAVWEQFGNIAKYFTQNFAAAASTEIISTFEMGNAAFIISGSWNIGVLNAEINAMGDKGFEWGSMPFPPYENPPAGFQKVMRTLYGVGNTMGIVMPKGEGDHLERVKDFYKFVYCPDGCKAMFETTLNAGNFIQGPPAIKGFTLPEELVLKMNGFIQEGAGKADFSAVIGQDAYLAEDKGAYVDALNKFLAGETDAKTFCETVSPIWMRYLDDHIEKNGFDLDPSTKDTPKE